MKHIMKNAEPMSFANWKSRDPNLQYKDLKDTPKAELKKSLIKEQRSLCCYCECLINETNSHIEHFRPKDCSQFPELQLAYSNLHVSCGKFGTGTPEEHCGHRKSNFYSADLVSPLETDCASHFSYNTHGEIKGLDTRGIVTISKLHLNSTLLSSQRKKLIQYFEELTEEEKQEEMQHHLQEDGNKLGEFYTMIDYLKEVL